VSMRSGYLSRPLIAGHDISSRVGAVKMHHPVSCRDEPSRGRWWWCGGTRVHATKVPAKNQREGAHAAASTGGRRVRTVKCELGAEGGPNEATVFRCLREDMTRQRDANGKVGRGNVVRMGSSR
jgi:hypothetical protein